MLPRTNYLIAGLALGIPSQVAASFKWVGTSEAGAEFGSAYPGTLGTDYIWPDLDAIKTLNTAGMNIFRVPFSMERLVPSALSGPADATYLGDLKDTINGITGLGAYAVLDPHNYGRYFGNVITSTTDFAAFWTIVATEFADNDLVIFDTNNEYNNMDQTLVLNLNQASIDAIRNVATSQYIFVEGNAWSGAWDWTSYNDNLVGLEDPSDSTNSKIIYEMHQYLDSDSSGTSETCSSSTIGSQRLASATAWLRENGKVGVIGEFAGGNNDVCKSAVADMLNYMDDNDDVWLGALWWAAGPWWGSYMYSLEPTAGVAYGAYLDILSQYFVDASSSSLSSSTKTTLTNTATTVTTTTTATTTTTSQTTTRTTTTATTTTSATSGTAARWGQCGGNGWTGPTACASPYTCQVQNDWYSQCL